MPTITNGLPLSSASSGRVVIGWATPPGSLALPISVARGAGRKSKRQMLPSRSPP